MKSISEILVTGTSQEKIKILETLTDVKNPEILEKIILGLDDDDIQVRGEAFSSLVLNKNKIEKSLIRNLESSNKNIKGFASLVLANRNDSAAIPKIMKLVEDEHSMVRSCAIGALRHLKALEAEKIILQSLLDSNLEVKKSALQAIMDLDFIIPEEIIIKISKDDNPEIKKILLELKR
ncbi:MAG: HEAT repeat domain-containing protein [Thaumarchaeota archaeon]|nr:HEAT repeat domain-containing protein [Nitrososphaerota archaeon]MBT5842377.1 HEAT repeat domain-containing protein [Nitrososphaerota archaeon]MBT6469434.1 HEAT repeat domain-containing protein [Nitrososphaerota archaeon]